MVFQYGIEHEIAFLNKQGEFADFSNTDFSIFASIIDSLPLHETDYPQLRVGDAGIKLKRWYIEGYERFTDKGEVSGCSPKGIEIRTTIHRSIGAAINELNESYQLLIEAIAPYDLTPVSISFNPIQKEFLPTPPLSNFEIKRRLSSPEKQTADIPMMSYGPDLSLSALGMSVEKMIDVAKKLTYYSPWIVPFSFSSPFYENKLWDGLSVRTWHRTGARPAVMVFLPEGATQIQSTPSLTQVARVKAEEGRIEFKAFDSCADFDLYASLLTLLKGLILDTTLERRAVVPDEKEHKYVALHGFNDKDIHDTAVVVLEAAYSALIEPYDKRRLEPLFLMLDKTIMTQAEVMKQRYEKTGSLLMSLKSP
ncbi:MAG: glutamate--cysteine ligase [Cocleimonas sp.]|nr:glutamate--cysteine ligase [Cocleimonas sp.]